MIRVISPRVGLWMLRRSTDNGAAMTGTATIAARADGSFDYHERGRLRLADGQTIDAERRYIFAEEPGGFVVLFAESPPRLFHRVALVKTAACWTGTAVHRCGDDRYDSRYEFHSEGSFAIRHAVAGPRKRYTIASCYSRVAIAALPA